MRISWKRGALAVVALLLAGGALVASGLVPIRASSDHWPVTRWLLDFAKRRSVATHAMGVQVPDLDDPARILKGAGHYEIGCSPCHGRPGRGRSEIVLEMTPHPPLLRETLERWEPPELFYIVRHGIKFTAMPAWPVDGGAEEVWDVVAFLQRMPEMEEEVYERLAFGALAGDLQGDDRALPTAPDADPMDADSLEDSLARAPAPVLQTCGRCHGTEGRGRGPGAFPSLAGQRPAYLERSLRAFARGDRPSGIMHVVAASLDSLEIGTLSRYFAGRGTDEDDALATAAADPATGLPPQRARPDQESVRRGESLAREGAPGSKVPSCIHCHGPGDRRRNPSYPVLAGQYRAYLAQQLRLFRGGLRNEDGYAGIMHEVLRDLDGEQLDDLAAYYASLGAGR